MRAGLAALVLGIAGGLAIATGVLSMRGAPAPTTVAEALALDGGGPDLDRRRADAVAILVSACMRRHGWSWKPWPEPPMALPDASMDPVSWADRWGFGVTTGAAAASAPAPIDPNLSSLARLAPDDRDRMRVALFGDGSRGGCQAQATSEVYGLRERLLAPIRPALEDLDRRIAADPAAATVQARWRACVGPIAGGLPLDRRTLAASLVERFAARVASFGTVPAAIAGRAALQVEERRVAASLARCETAYETDRANVAAPHEAAFVLEQRAALEAVGRTIRAAEAALPTLPP